MTVLTERFESCKPENWANYVVIRRSTYPNGTVRFHYWGRALRWLPIKRDLAAMAIANAAAEAKGI